MNKILTLAMLWWVVVCGRAPLACGDEPPTPERGRETAAADDPSRDPGAAQPDPRSKPQNLERLGSDATGTGSSQPGTEPAEGLIRLDPKAEIWVDRKHKRLIVGGQICLRQGLLEMFACPRGTKEHESIVAVNTKAYLVHAGLLAIGAKPGRPVQYAPVYQPATGTRIDVLVLWRGADGKVVRRRAQEMIRHVKTRQPMDHDWVFAGSGFWVDETTGEQFYQAEGGELICVSNFSTATLDLTVESPRDNAELLFEAWTDNIPELGTKVRLVLSVAE